MALSVVIVIDADPGGELLDGLGEKKSQVADRMSTNPVLKPAASDAQRRLYHRLVQLQLFVVLAENLEGGPVQWTILIGILQQARDPLFRHGGICRNSGRAWVWHKPERQQDNQAGCQLHGSAA